MCEICDIQQLIDCLKQEKETNDVETNTTENQ